MSLSKWISIAALSLAIAVSSPAWATMTFVGVNANTVSGLDLTDLTKPVLYGGIAGTCAGDAVSTCDSCTGGLTACNQKNIYDSLKVILTLQTTTTGFTTSDFIFENSSGTTAVNATVPNLSADGTLTVVLTWGEICSALGKSNCIESVTGNFKIGLKNSSAEELITVTAKVRVEKDPDHNVYNDCDDEVTDGSPGACHFEAARGDEKIYVNQLVFSEGYPTTSVASGIPYTDVIMFYASEPESTADDLRIIASISNKSESKVLTAAAAGANKVTDNRMTGLQNDQRYCMLMANRDASGVISFFTPVDQRLPATICATPSKVVGLLDDKSCFIATAAFGSSMAPEVESFREFRNHFLLTNPMGKSFVRFYYKYSPYYANLIAESEVAKVIVRTALWPLLLFARVALVFGFWMTLVLAGLSALGIYEIYRRFFIGRRFRGEL